MKAKADTPLTPCHHCLERGRNSRTADENVAKKRPELHEVLEADRGQRHFASHVERWEISVDGSLIPCRAAA